MQKKEFTKIINELVSIKNDEENLNKAFKKFEPDFNYISFGRYETLIIRSLELAMNDTSKWISYWIYDCYRGKKDMLVKDKNGKKVPLKTPNDLYECIKNL